MWSTVSGSRNLQSRNLMNCPAAAAATGVLLQQAPLMLMQDGMFQLPPGCIPPPAAFFLVEQLLRESPSPSAVCLAVQLLRGSMALVAAARRPQQQQEAADHWQAGEPELQRLAYCSLASSVVAAILRHQLLGAECEGEVLELARELTQAAAKEATAVQGSSTTSTGSGGGSSSTNTGGRWSLAASLAAAVAAGGYTAHLGGVASINANNNVNTTTTTTSSSSSSKDMVPEAGCSTAASPCPSRCALCHCASQMGVVLGSLERGPASTALECVAAAAALMEAVQQQDTSLTQQQLLTLAWRHPVPYVCGNVLCVQLEGPSAVGVVRNRLGTLCGGCRAAWYCCEECQRAAWEAHREVCGVSGST
jgi:hypothetical protein